MRRDGLGGGAVQSLNGWSLKALLRSAFSFNDQPIPCRDTTRKAMTYRLVKSGVPLSTLRVSLGGLWEREVLIQGNAVFRATQSNSNRIVVPPR